MRYIGETDRSMKYRFSEHKGYVKNDKKTHGTGLYLNQPGHSLNDMKLIILDKFKKL